MTDVKIEKLPALVYRADETAEKVVDFLVVEGLDYQWDLPEVWEANPLLVDDVPFSVRREYDFSPPQITDRPYFWVSYRGLRNVMQFKNSHAKTMVEKLPPTLVRRSQLGTSDHAFTDQNWSVIMAKPDALARGLGGAVEQSIMNSGLTIEAFARREELTVEDVGRIWTPPYKWNPPMEPEEWWHETVRYMTEGPIEAYLVSGQAATDRVKAIRESIRAIYGANPHGNDDRPIAEKVRSLIHTSDRTEELLRNASLLWTNQELHTAINRRFEEVEGQQYE